jgi:predicted AlkP superfamily phosphohydrolase/phosphomutase
MDGRASGDARRSRRELMIAIFQFDSVSVPLLNELLTSGSLPALENLRRKGTWLSLGTPAEYLEGSGSYAIYTGTDVGVHGQYYPWLWSSSEQRVRFMDDLPVPETVWERLGRAGRRSLIIDPYEIRPPKNIRGLFLSGWQFKNRIVLRSCSLPTSVFRSLERELGRPPVGEEVYGTPSTPELLRLRNGLLAAPDRLSSVTTRLLKREEYDVVWVTASAAHLAGHRFLRMSQVAGEIDLAKHSELKTTVTDIYRATDKALKNIIEILPPDADILVVSPAGMGPNSSRSHLLPHMLNAVLAGRHPRTMAKGAPSSSSLLSTVRSMVPTELRSWIAKMLPDKWAVELATRLELRGVDWSHTRAFMMPNDDAGFVRLNLRGRERDGIVDPSDGEALLEMITTGLKTFKDPDGRPAIKKVVRISELGIEGPRLAEMPDLVVQWNDRAVAATAGVASTLYGEISSRGWGTGRTGCHTGDAWVLVVPARSRFKAPLKSPHVVDIAATVCSLLGADTQGLTGQPLLA